MSTPEFNTLVVKNEAYLQPFAFSLTKDTEAAKDLLQETMFKALSNKEKFNVGTNLKAWMYTIMRNIFINNYRKVSKHQTLIDHSPSEYKLNNNYATSRFEAERKVISSELNEALDKLPAIFKNPFMLFVDGYHYNEISDILGEPLGTIKSRIHFARKLLKANIERY
jgi:RNA polymerase sigma factor (sigma-70 family)